MARTVALSMRHSLLRLEAVHSVLMHFWFRNIVMHTLRSSRFSSQSLQGSVGSVHVEGSLSALRKLPGLLPKLWALRALPVSEMGIDLQAALLSVANCSQDWPEEPKSNKANDVSWSTELPLFAADQIVADSLIHMSGL